jgi:hypothetical protein
MIIVPNCFFRKCKHYIGVENMFEAISEDSEKCVCEAFPEGIPDEIAYGDNKHDKPFKGDNGIQYQKQE